MSGETSVLGKHARIGLLVNPIAGIGGAVGLKGSDGEVTVQRALALGAVAHAEERAQMALSHLVARLPQANRRLEVLAGPGRMGELVAREVGVEPVVTGRAKPLGETTFEDTRRTAAAMLDAGVDLLLVAGGDGTARDVCASVGTKVPVLGIPAGVKIHSPVYATSPTAAGELAAAFLSTDPNRRRTTHAEVLDLDESAYRRGEIAPRLFGELSVPAGDRRIQGRKEPSPTTESTAAEDVAEGVLQYLMVGDRCILAPGSTVRAVASRLGVAKTLVGVDVVDIVTDLVDVRTSRKAKLVASDVSSGQLERLSSGGRVVLIVTPIGGQGFILGRGNQQLSPAVIRSVLAASGRRGIVVAATPAKLASLRGAPLLVDSGDRQLDASLEGYLVVVSGSNSWTPYRVTAA